MVNQMELKKTFKKYFETKYKNIDEDENQTHDINMIINLLLRIDKLGNKECFNNDMDFIDEFNDEIKEIIKIDENQGKIKYTRTGYYKLNDGKKTSGYDAMRKCDKHYINEILNKEKINIIENIINNYFINVYIPKNRKPDIEFKIEHTNAILSKDKYHIWEYQTERRIRNNKDFKYLFNKYL
jgi:hypothetical protein